MTTDLRIGEKEDLIIRRGDTTTIVVAITADGAPMDITDYTVRFVVKRDYTSVVAVITKTTSSGIVLTNPTAGELTITLAPADTEDLSPGTYYYDLELTSSTGSVGTYLWGKLTIEADIA